MAFITNEEYLEALQKEKARLDPLKPQFPYCWVLIEEEITRIKNVISEKQKVSGPTPAAPTAAQSAPPRMTPASSAPPPAGPPPPKAPSAPAATTSSMRGPPPSSAPSSAPVERLVPFGPAIPLRSVPIFVSPALRFEKVFLPTDQFPHTNFVGKLMGPRKVFIERLSRLTKARFSFRGRGSMRNPREEEELRWQSGNEHLQEALHIGIEVDGNERDTEAAVRKAVNILSEMCHPDASSEDVLRKYENAGPMRQMPPGPPVERGPPQSRAPSYPPSSAPPQPPFHSRPPPAPPGALLQPPSAQLRAVPGPGRQHQHSLLPPPPPPPISRAPQYGPPSMNGPPRGGDFQARKRTRY